VTDGVTLAVAAVAASVAAAAAWLHHPRAPALEAERWFKLWVATRLRGVIETRAGSSDAWVIAVLRFVPYHPLGRQPAAKVHRPDAWRPADGWLEGEQALVQRLAAEPTEAARWSLLYDRDERGVEARLADPATLGPAYDPVSILGGGQSWDAVAAGGLLPALARRLGAAWVLVDGRGAGPDLLGAVARGVPGSVRIPSEDDLEGWVNSLHAALQQQVEAPADRVVIVAADTGIQAVLRVLVRDPGLRDRVLAVVSIGGVLGGLPDDDGPLGERALSDWMGRWFGHDTLDTDALVPTPYLALQWWDIDADPSGALGVPIRAARWPAPRAPAGVPESILPIELGLLPTDPELPLDCIAEALVGVTVGTVLAWR
jgi:hypothetical protein